MRVQKRRVQNIEKRGRISMANCISDRKGLRKVDKIEELGIKICKFVNYYEKIDFFTHDDKEKNLALAALADLLINIREVFKSCDVRFKIIETELGIYTEKETKEIKAGMNPEDVTKLLKVIAKAILKDKITVGDVESFDRGSGWKEISFCYMLEKKRGDQNGKH